MTAQIRQADMQDTDRVVEILNTVTLHLHNKGINQWEYPWSIDKIRQEVERGCVFLLMEDALTVGTFSIKASDSVDVEMIERGNKYLYRIAVLPEYQGNNLGEAIVKYAIDYSKKLSQDLYLDCWAGNVKLRNFYSKAGFEHMGDAPEEGYFISVFKSN